MKVISNPKIVLDTDDRELFFKLEGFINDFNGDFCMRANCDDCPYSDNCDNAFGRAKPPYEVVNRLITFFQSLPYEED